MLTFRCLQTKDPGMLRDMHWLKSEEGFGTEDKGAGLAAVFKTAQEELLSPDERTVPVVELQPPEKRKALVFYAQIRNGFKPDVDEDNWVSLGFCTAANPESEQRLASAYGSLVERCQFDEFWNAMVDSRMVELFRKYGLADRNSYTSTYGLIALGNQIMKHGRTRDRWAQELGIIYFELEAAGSFPMFGDPGYL